MEIEVLLDLIELILTQKNDPGAFSKAILKRKFCFPYFDYLLNEGFLPDNGALLAATQMRQIEIVRFVLEKGVKPTLEAFQYAAENEFFELCRLFVKFGSREILSTPELEKQFRMAIFDNQKIAIKLINQGVDPKTNNSSAIQNASSLGYFEIVRLLLKHGAVLNADNNWAIETASSQGHHKIVQLLLDYGADPTADNNFAIKMASRGGHLEVVRSLLENSPKYKVDPTASDNYAIRHASGDNRLKIIELLKQYGARL